MATLHPCFATCPPGLEPLLHAELKALRMARVERQVAGVAFAADREGLWRANLRLRTAIRVLMRLDRFPARDEAALYEGVRAVDWSRWVKPEGTLWVDVRSSSSELSHTRFLAQRTKDAVCDQLLEQLGARPSVEREGCDLRINLHLVRDRATLALDSSGDSLHRRGWRREQGRAPLSEVLASALIELSGWDRRAPLLDPFCGSGTIAIEAARLAAGQAGGELRSSFGFERWPDHDERRFAAWRERELVVSPRGKPPRVIALDSSPERVEDTRANALAAGVGEAVEVERGDARTYPFKPGWNAFLVANLPYGERVGRDVLELHQAFGRTLRERCSGYEVALLVGDDQLADALQLTEAERLPFSNGGLDCRVVRGRIA